MHLGTRILGTGAPLRALAARLPGVPALLGALLVAGLLAAALPAHAQTAQEILERAMAGHEARLAGIENVTLHQEMMGIRMSTYLVKDEVDGHPILRPDLDDPMDADVDPGDEFWNLWSDPRAMYVEWGELWQLEGRSSVDGRATWRLVFTDFDQVEFEEDPLLEEEDDPFEPTRLVLDLETDRLVPLRMEMAGDILRNGQRHPVAMEIFFSDYRDVQGYLHPFLTVIETDMGAEGLSPEERAEMEQAMEEFRREMEQAPPEQREMMERMMGDQFEAMEQMLAGETLRFELRVTDLQVNAGPPGGG